MESKKRLDGITFARAFCAIGIIIFHFFCHSHSKIKFFFIIKNCSWGDILVTVFFAISGAVLYYNYENITNLKKYFYKRWKTIYIPFYICYFIFLIEKIILSKKLFWGGNPIRILLSFLGIDGYLSYRLSTYYLVGEWFLGAIILIYLLYPVICLLIKKNQLIIPIVLIIGYIIQYLTNFFKISNFWNLITCLGSFYFGILCIRNRTIILEKFLSGLTAIILFLIVLILDFNISLKAQILGMLLFIFLVVSGNYLLKISLINAIITFISGISFYIFLIQHQIILNIFHFYNPGNFIVVLPLLCTIIILTIILSKVIQFITEKFIYTSKCIQFLDEKFLIDSKE